MANESNPNVEQFKKELKALLEKYGATIYTNVHGDTHGLLYDTAVQFGSDKWKEYKLTDKGEIEASDL